jgi:tRNA (cmo5U34)-methyltransferase
MTQDRIYSQPLAQIGQFQFDDSVADVFPDMIARSVPGYSSMLAMVEQITQTHAIPDSQLYDLGCSLGAATHRIRQHAPTSCQLHAVDSSAAMIARLSKLLEQERVGSLFPKDDPGNAHASEPGQASIADVSSKEKTPDPLTASTVCETILHESDIRSVAVQNASVVVLNLTLQFLPPAERTPLLQSIADGMLPGGALLLSEKVCFDDPEEQQLMTDLHLDFKRAHGYSELEIAQKRSSLEETLIPESLSAHLLRLRACGFRQASVWFQCFNFASMIAIR